MNTKGDLIFLLQILADRDVSHPNEIFPDFFQIFRGKLIGKMLGGKIGRASCRERV